MRKSMPTTGSSWDDLKTEMATIAENDADWRGGRTAVYVFNAGDDVSAVAADAYRMFLSENALGARRAFPSLARMESDVVQFGLSLLNAPDAAVGDMTSGGTESIMLAVKACRDYWRAKGRDVSDGEILAPQSVHPAFNKAAQYLGLKVVRIAVTEDLTADAVAMATAVNAKTLMIVGSMPCFPYGVIDPIADLSDIALEHDLWLHVDACVGGYFAPFARLNGVNLPPFDFALPGVCSMSADLHKYGYTAKGASTIFYRDEERRQGQIFAFGDWPCGVMQTHTLPGTRPGGAIAAAWAVMSYLGVDGYREKAQDVVTARQRLVAGFKEIEGIEVFGAPQLGLIAYGAKDCDIHAVADRLAAAGWVSARIDPPRGIHLMLSPRHLDVVDDYLTDLQTAIAAVRAEGATSAGGAVYS